MNLTEFDDRVRAQAGAFAYPQTPDVARRARARLAAPGPAHQPRRAVLAIACAALLVCGVLAVVPQARALVLRILRIGAVQIVLPEPTATPPPTAAAVTATSTAPQTATPTVQPIQDALFPLLGKTTLADARASAPFAIPLPQIPADLGPPDLVFKQRQFDEADMVVLIWLDPTNRARARMSLHLLTKDLLGQKLAPRVITQTTVSGLPAVWAEGRYGFVLRSGSFEIRRIVEGNTLIWERAGITYRLESTLTLEAAQRVAESLR